MIFTKNKSKIQNTDFEFHQDNATTLSRTDSTKILGVHFQQLNWDNHITELSKTCYAILSAPQKMKRTALFNIRKHFCESLVLSKLDYTSNVLDLLMIIQKRQLHKIKNSCAALVFNQCCLVSDVLSLEWLPIKEHTEMRMVNSSYQALHNKNVPEYLKLIFTPKKCLLQACNDTGPMVEILQHRNSFNSRAANLLNKLPKNIKRLNKENIFKSETKKYFYDRSLACFS